MQSQICGWETGSFGIKTPPRPNAFCLLHQFPNRCHVCVWMDYGVTAWGSRLKLSLGNLETFSQVQKIHAGARSYPGTGWECMVDALVVGCRAGDRVRAGLVAGCCGDREIQHVGLSASVQECWGLRPERHVMNVPLQF